MNTFLSNQSSVKFLDHIRQSLNSCTEFTFSVSFIKYAGVRLIENEIISALKRGVKGKIITSTYQNFTDIKSLNVFLELMKKYPNFDCHLEFKNFKSQGFHTKGYMFVFEKAYEVIVGSSNITRFALLNNFEWNASIVNTSDSLYLDFHEEFKYIWENTYQLSQLLIDKYHLILEYAIEAWDMDYYLETKTIEPNLMQRNALKELRRLRNLGERKALVIAATGSGKTFLAAFDSFNFGAKKVLFICHRENILHDAMNTFNTVYSNSRTTGIYQGINQKDRPDFIFSTNVMMNNHLSDFSAHEFDYIIIDEVHHAVASTYQKIINYFEPDFLLGLTATPERLDNENVFSIFEHNVPYELRLRDALNLDLVVPFHYYGVKDDFFEYDKDNRRYLINSFMYQENINFISSKIELYRPKNTKLSAIAFCSSVTQSKQFSDSFNDLGYKTISLTGESSIGERILAFQRLQSDDDLLDIIFTVDILNEGIDIPGINMVLFLRPTESPTIFIQQLGRGLRKYQNKEYLTVLDFIGNSYTRSVQIALAVGSLTENIVLDKITIKDYIKNGFPTLPNNVQIEFDSKSKEEILNSLSKTNFNSKEYIITDYKNIKKYRGQIDYIKHVELLDTEIISNPYRFIKKYKSYYNFLMMAENVGVIPVFTSKEVRLLEYLTSMLPLVRPYDFLILKHLLDNECHINELMNLVKYEYSFNELHFAHSIKYLQDKLSKNQNEDKILIRIENGVYKCNIEFENAEYKDFLIDLLSFGLEEYNIKYGDFTGDFVLHKKYYKDQTTLIQLKESIYTPVQGIVYEGNEVIFFINLIKSESEDPRLKYIDHFLDESTLVWESQNDTTLTNTKGNRLLSFNKAKLFVRQYDTEDGFTMPFTYLGFGKFVSVEETNNPNSTLRIHLSLDNPLPKYLQAEFMNLEDKNEKDS